MKRNRFTETLLLCAVGFVVLALVALGGLWVRYIHLNDGTTELVRHTETVIGQLNELKIALLQVENDERGYLITGRDDMLEPYEQMHQQVLALQRQIAAAVEDNTVQVMNAGSLKVLLEAKLVSSRRMVRLRQSEGMISSLAIIGSGQDEDEYRVIVALIDRMLAEENRLLNVRRQAVHDSFGSIKLLAGTSVAIMLVLLIAVGWLVRKDLQRQSALMDKLNQIAHHDELTGLPNRRYFGSAAQAALSLAARHQRLSAVMMLDLDGFKAVNDTFGHEAGDVLLREVAVRIRNTIRSSDFVARFGGDEFAMLLPEVEGLGTITTVCRKVLKAVGAPYVLDIDEEPKELVGVSIGVAVAPHHGADIETLLSRADMALYRAKQAGKGQYDVYAPVDMETHNSPAEPS